MTYPDSTKNTSTAMPEEQAGVCHAYQGDTLVNILSAMSEPVKHAVDGGAALIALGTLAKYLPLDRRPAHHRVARDPHMGK
jgi:hypothetical protein